MKKKNLAILLVIPFLVALFGIVTINAAFNVIDNDVIRINWDYRDNELFAVGETVTLEAQSVIADSRYPASAGNRLVWTVENADGAAEPHAETFSGGNDIWFLRTKSVGKVTITCSTEKGNITPVRMTGIIYSGSAFVINTKVNGSGQNVDSTIYYGQYDLNGGQKVPAQIGIDLTVSDDSLLRGITIDEENTSSNLTVDLDKEIITIDEIGEGISKVTLVNDEQELSAELSFEVVENGINVYNYADLLACTNSSKEGEIVVLRKNFESKDVVNATSANNVTLFGTEKGAGFNFAEEVYRFPTTYNSEYITQWNNFAARNSGYEPIATGDTILAGLRIRKDFYGNGFTINLHNLCFPSVKSELDYDIYTLGENDLFRGPKPFYLLGDPNSSAPLVTAFGQDNVGLYIDGNNITVNDVKVKNCDFGLVVNNLTYTGTVVEVNGSDNTVKNSVLSNGKNVMRSFSSMNLTVDNCILSTSRNFLLTVGSNRYEKNSSTDRTQHTFTNYEGRVITTTLSSYLSANYEGDRTLNLFNASFTSINDLLFGGGYVEVEKEQMRAALKLIQKALNREDIITEDAIDGTTEINDTIFYRSGIAAIGVETMFNGPFLYNNSPSAISGLLGLMGSFLDVVIPTFPNNIAGASYPVTVNLSGNTRFFDYKTLDEWDISGLIDQNISSVVRGLGTDIDITIDDIFPLKSILTNVANSNKLIYEANGDRYINIPIAYYGGGRNLSKVTTNGLTAGGVTKVYDVELLDSYLNMKTSIDLTGLLSGGGMSSIVSDPQFMRYMREVLTKTVTSVTGFEAFKFQFGNDPQGVFDIESGKPLQPDYSYLYKA